MAIFFLSLVTCHTGFGQLDLKGPTCVIAGTEYQYDIQRNKSKEINMKVCINGGVLTGTDSTCKSGMSFNFIRVVWNNDNQGDISIATSQGNTTLKVQKTQSLGGGKISFSSKLNSVELNLNQVPSSVLCSSASGGSCSPKYKYQWQLSVDGVGWTDIKGADAQNLVLASATKNNTYYRRKVKDLVSGSEDYSDIAVVVINTSN